jgi:predicted PurR-regulated permease PerM
MNDISHYLNEWLISMMQQLVRLYTTEMSGILSILDDIILGGIISVYLLNSKELLIAQFKKCIYGLFSLSHANIIISDLRLANKMFSGFLSGTILDSVIVGSVCFIGTWLLNIPYSVLVSIIIGITNIIPFFGPYIGAIPCILLILFVSPEKSLHFLIFIIILQNIDGNFVAPKILGIRTGISSFWVLISVILSGGLFGFWGLLFGVPVFAFFYALIKAKINRALSRKNLPIDTAAYLVLQEKEIEKRN